MKIYTQFGLEVEITADHAHHSYKGTGIRLVTVRDPRSGKDYLRGLHSLKCDGGITELIKAADEAPKVELKGKELDTALMFAR